MFPTLTEQLVVPAGRPTPENVVQGIPEHEPNLHLGMFEVRIFGSEYELVEVFEELGGGCSK